MNSNSFWNWISVQGSAYHEAGPFTEENLNSRDLGANLQFTVGRPWGKTAFVTGYTVRDLLFNPQIREFFTTSTYGGITRKFGTRVKVTGLAEYIRSWRVQNIQYAIAQALSPAGLVDYRVNRNWEVNFSGSWGRGMGFATYDNIQSGFLISYVKPIRRSVDDEAVDTGRLSAANIRRIATARFLQLHWPEAGYVRASISPDSFLGQKGFMKICLVTAFPPSRRAERIRVSHRTRVAGGLTA